MSLSLLLQQCPACLVRLGVPSTSKNGKLCFLFFYLERERDRGEKKENFQPGFGPIFGNLATLKSCDTTKQSVCG